MEERRTTVKEKKVVTGEGMGKKTERAGERMKRDAERSGEKLKHAGKDVKEDLD